MSRKVNRSARSGKFVTKDEVKKSPATTTTEKVNSKPRSRSQARRQAATAKPAPRTRTRTPKVVRQGIDVDGVVAKKGAKLVECHKCNGTGQDFTDGNKACEACKTTGLVTPARAEQADPSLAG